jgi:hypothetical protein
MSNIINIDDYIKSWKSPEPINKLDEIDDEDFQIVRAIMFPEGLDVLSWFDNEESDTVNLIAKEIADNKTFQPLDTIPPAITWWFWKDIDSEVVSIIVVDHDEIRMITYNGRMIIPVSEQDVIDGLWCGPINTLI